MAIVGSGDLPLKSLDNIQTILINAINAKWPELNAQATCVNSMDIVLTHPKLPGWKLEVLQDRVKLRVSYSLDMPTVVGEIPSDGSFSCMMKMRDEYEISFADPQLVSKVISDISGHLDDSIWPVGLSIDISRIMEAATKRLEDVV